jgi:hypothetical protein
VRHVSSCLFVNSFIPLFALRMLGFLQVESEHYILHSASVRLIFVWSRIRDSHLAILFRLNALGQANTALVRLNGGMMLALK